MWEESFKWLNEHYHGLAILLVGMAIALIFARQYYKWTGRVKKKEEECHRIDNHIVPSWFQLIVL
jgi:hypothetical protein